MVIRVFKNKEAIEEVKKLCGSLESENVDRHLIGGWYVDKSPSCYLLYEGGTLKAFALVTKCDFDPMKEQSNPHVLNYIYTLRAFRNEGHAQEIIAFLKTKIDFSCFCMNDEAVNLFSKAGCRNCGPLNNTTLFRSS